MFKENRLIYLHSPAEALGNELETAQTQESSEALEANLDHNFDLSEATQFVEKMTQDPELAGKTPEERQKVLEGKIDEGIVKFLGNIREIKTQFSQNEVAIALINKKKGFYLLQSIADFPEIDHKKVVQILIQKNQGRYVCANLDNLQVDRREILSDLIQTGQFRAIEIYKKGFETIPELEKMIKEGKKNQQRAEERQSTQRMKKAETAYDNEWQSNTPQREREREERRARLQASKPN